MEPKDISIPEFLIGGGEAGEIIRSKNWSDTPLGNPNTWPQSLKTCVRIILTSSQPMFVWWGKDLINIYNDAYKAIVGGKHPWAFGKPASEVWKEIWNEVDGIQKEASANTFIQVCSLVSEPFECVCGFEKLLRRSVAAECI